MQKKEKKKKRNDFVSVTNICDTDYRALILRLQPYLLKLLVQSFFVAFSFFCNHYSFFSKCNQIKISLKLLFSQNHFFDCRCPVHCSTQMS